jgi:hypothetical protein
MFKNSGAENATIASGEGQAKAHERLYAEAGYRKAKQIDKRLTLTPSTAFLVDEKNGKQKSLLQFL